MCRVIKKTWLEIINQKILSFEDNNVSSPVMLLIHGRTFKMGSSMNLASDLIDDNGVVLVTINY
ncbi:COesterase domain containing protein [Asbolus verrucosus]|uniref:COesterase domain containing protein n=1 Tax=Asbolus verrucosus TaxID=1661398 RepID=A0A482VB04_ASBVE|nr:COesterase domain containing protein [Asbolus verrucosus]